MLLDLRLNHIASDQGHREQEPLRTPHVNLILLFPRATKLIQYSMLSQSHESLALNLQLGALHLSSPQNV